MNLKAFKVQLKPEKRESYLEVEDLRAGREDLFGEDGSAVVEVRHTRGGFYIVVKPGAKSLFYHDQVNYHDVVVLEEGPELTPIRYKA